MQSLPSTTLRNHTVTRLKAPGTCGEFVQGAIDEQDFLVNCPVDLYSAATVTPCDCPGLSLQHAAQFNKIRDAVALAEYEFVLELQHHVSVTSDIPRGKGMASSTADITAALTAVLRSCDCALSAAIFARILTEVEPSDCVHFSGIAHVNHLTGDLLESLPAPADLRALVVDCGGEVDTIGFDRDRARAVYRAHQPQIKQALQLLKRGLIEGQPAWVAEAATQSAMLSQQIHFKPQFEALLTLVREAGALGVNCAHSGSVLGVLYRGSDALGTRLVARIEQAFGRDLPIIGDLQIIGGGCLEH
jgi:L-threonine kinase